jgi:hypothetical protein
VKATGLAIRPGAPGEVVVLLVPLGMKRSRPDVLAGIATQKVTRRILHYRNNLPSS